MAYFIEKCLEVPFGAKVDFDYNNKLILLQQQHEQEFFIDMYNSDFELYSKIRVKQLFVRDQAKVSYRPVPTSLGTKHSVLISPSALILYQHQDFVLTVKFGKLMKSSHVLAFEWINGNVLLICTEKSAYIKKILWPKSKNLAPILDSEFQLPFKDKFVSFQFIEKDLVLVKLEKDYQLLAINEQKLTLQLNVLPFSSQLKSFGYVIKQQLKLLCDDRLNDNIKRQIDVTTKDIGQQSHKVEDLVQLGIYYDNIAINSLVASQEKELIFFLDIQRQTVLGYSLTKGKTILDFKIPSAKYSEIFIVDSFLYCFDVNSNYLICYDLLNWNGELSAFEQQQSVQLSQNVQSRYKLLPSFIQKINFNSDRIVRAERPHGVQSSEDGVSSSEQQSIEIRYPFMIQNLTQLKYLQIDGRRMLKDLGQPEHPLELFKHLCISVHRPLNFVEPILEQLLHFLQAQSFSALHCFEILLNRAYEVRMQSGAYQISPDLQLVDTTPFQRSFESKEISQSSVAKLKQQPQLVVQKFSATQQIASAGKVLVFRNTFMVTIQQIIEVLLQLTEVKKQKMYIYQFLQACCSFAFLLNSFQLSQLMKNFSKQEIMKFVSLKIILLCEQNIPFFLEYAQKAEGKDQDLLALVSRIYQPDQQSERNVFSSSGQD